jgi:hypothetical protein
LLRGDFTLLVRDWGRLKTKEDLEKESIEAPTERFGRVTYGPSRCFVHVGEDEPLKVALPHSSPALLLCCNFNLDWYAHVLFVPFFILV